MTGLLRSTIDCIVGTTSPFPVNIMKYDCVSSQHTSIILVCFLYLSRFIIIHLNINTTIKS
jgi:hypothetical protein